MGKSSSRGDKCSLLFSDVTHWEDDGGGGGGGSWALSGEDSK